MRIRSIILAAAIPLLLLLAAVNGALLYFQTEAEMRRGLDARALAAAITTAEFLSAMDDPAARLANPVRRTALISATRQVEGLEGLYLVNAAGRAMALVPPDRPWTPDHTVPRAAAEVSPLTNIGGNRHIVARARLAGGGFVAARIDAEPLFARLADLLRWIVAGVAAAGGVGLAAGWHVARRIQRELAVSRRLMTALDTGAPAPETTALTITEASDLAAALRLLDANRRAALSGLDKRLAQEDRDRTDAAALATWRSAAFPAIDATTAGARVAARLCGNAAPGSFFALCETQGQAALVTGECDGDPREALVHAIAARDFLERHWHERTPDDALKALRESFAATQLRHLAWSESEPPAAPRLLAIIDAATAAESYVRTAPDAPPATTVDRIDALLEPDGILAVVGPA
ncbi:MAG TPA: hypothetical protein VHO04_11910 [Sphingopyxis sp.]|uniref:hypothetical protein n=1 Tax=Sphingopyxis sp. TaxID=1908224 RepID=UPI002E313868|nr:hypothetical protein [Sphingopyxis sp.]HEX2813379.1 hypothetical protein [Sphingopyxis sp.]